MGTELFDSTIEPKREGARLTRWRVPSLTVLFHPEVERIGEAARLVDALEGRSCALSRLEPRFAHPGQEVGGGAPLGDRHLGRRPARLLPENGGLRVQVPEGASAIRADGELVGRERLFEPERLERGVVLELSDRVVLLLHLLGPAAPPEPALGMVGQSEPLERVRSEVRRVADLAMPVLICGESGTGKELVASAIASAGPRARAPFVAVNLGAVPAALAGSELFGHAAGAFTGASGPHAGLFAQAHGGILFLDEVGAAPLDLQAMLLRAIETREVQPLGSDRRRVVDVRILAATDEDLDLAVEEGRFRRALHQRLAGYQIDLPPLRERRDDVGRLALHFLREELRAAGEEGKLDALRSSSPWLPPRLFARLAQYDWPGNVRQLANAMRRLAVASRGAREVGEDALPRAVLDRAPSPIDRGALAGAAPPRRSPSEIGEGDLLEALRASGWRVAEAARALGVSRPSLYALIDASPHIRKAKDVPADELRRSYADCGGDAEIMAQELQVSSRGIRLRLRELGLL